MEAHLKWVGIVVRDLEKAKALYTELFGAKFQDSNPFGGPHPVRTNVWGGNPPHKMAVDKDTGIELIQPLPGRDSEYARFLQEHGEGLLGMSFVTDDVEEVRRRVERMGPTDRVAATIIRALQFDQEEIERHPTVGLGIGKGNLKRIKIYLLKASPETCGVRIEVGQYDPK